MNDAKNAAKKLTINDVAGSPLRPKEELPKESRNKGKLALWAIACVVLLGAIGAATFYYMKYQDVKNDPKAAITEKNQVETDRVIASLKKALLIGETDAPTVARVEDPEKLKSSNQEFYKDIVKGDYLIIFPKRAIIYRESNNQIINIAPIINTADLKAKDGTTPAETDQATN